MTTWIKRDTIDDGLFVSNKSKHPSQETKQTRFNNREVDLEDDLFERIEMFINHDTLDSP